MNIVRWLCIGVLNLCVFPTISQINFQNSLKSAPLIAGHRGGFYENFPENSLQAFQETTQNTNAKPIFLELDIRESKNGHLYILHDNTLDRTTTGSGLISQLTDDEIQELFLKNEKGQITSYHIPSFNQVLHWVKTQKNVFLMLDVKGTSWKKVIRALTTTNTLQYGLFLTFKLADTQKVWSLAPQAFISTLVTSEADWLAIQALSIPSTQLVAYINPKTPSGLLATLHQQKITCMADVSENSKQHPYPFDSAYYQQLVASLQLDILITDYPVEVNRIFAKKKN